MNENENGADTGFEALFSGMLGNDNDDELDISKLIRGMRNIGDSEGDGGDMDANDYHNAATEHAKNNRYTAAAELCKKGLAKFPGNIDLLADVLHYSASAGDTETAGEYLRLLLAQDRRRWNWRAFTFTLDFLMEAPDVDERLCRELIADYHRLLPYEEKAYVAESELEDMLGNHERSLEILREALSRLNNACQCSLTLADRQLERGLYEEVIETTAYAFAASAEVQPSITLSYMVLVRCLAEDALLHRRLMRGESVTAEQINAVRAHYEQLKEAFPIARMRHGMTIDSRLGILGFISPNA